VHEGVLVFNKDSDLAMLEQYKKLSVGDLFSNAMS
jgi:hypothetical protein